MKCTIPEISWHNRDPVLSIDIQPMLNEEIYRLASGGADYHLLIWHLKILSSGAVNVDIVSDLTRHQKAVNVVRWSPSGQYLASGDDDANIIIWNLKTDNIPLLEGDSNDKEVWLVNKILRGHKEDVYDLCWSPNGLKLLSGSIDNTAILWDITKGKSENILSDHKGFVQGVAWDPKGQYISTLCSDRICRVFDNTGRSVKSRIYKGMLPVPESHSLYNKEVKYFHDDTFKSYFRRLSFSCDGNLLFLPSGYIDIDSSQVFYATFIFTLDRLTQPVAILPSPKQITIATRCCPVLFELYDDGPDPVINLPYRMVVAVATDRDVFLYDTQQQIPIAHFHRIHYTRITDLTWSADGRLLLASSTDGFCTFITFEKNELGIEYTKEESEEEDVQNSNDCEEVDNAKSVTKKPNILEQWTVKTTKNDTTNRPKPIAVRREPRRVMLTKVEDIEKKAHRDKDHVVPSGNDAETEEKCLTLDPTTPTKSEPCKNSQSNNDNADVEKTTQRGETQVIVIDDSSPVKTENSPSTVDRTMSDKLQTPKSIKIKSNGTTVNSNNRSKSASAGKKHKRDAKNALIRNSPLFKFLQTSTKKVTKSDKAATHDTNQDTEKEISSCNKPLSNCNNDIILVEDSNDADTNSSIEIVSEEGNDPVVNIEKENINLKMDTPASVTDDKIVPNESSCSLNENKQSHPLQALAKTPRRISLVTLSSPKRKKQE